MSKPDPKTGSKVPPAPAGAGASMTFQTWFHARHPAIALASATAVLRLAAGGATVPFIARYRKEETGGVDEVAIRQIIEADEQWNEIGARQKFIVEEIER